MKHGTLRLFISPSEVVQAEAEASENESLHSRSRLLLLAQTSGSWRAPEGRCSLFSLRPTQGEAGRAAEGEPGTM